MQRWQIFFTVWGYKIKARFFMLNTLKATIHLSAIALITFGASVVIPTNAQSRTADSFNFDEITADNKGNWNFSNVDETVSIRNNLNKLREYDISATEDYDIRIIRENRRRLGIKRWGNRGDRSYYSIDDGLYPYYFRDNRIYDYY